MVTRKKTGQNKSRPYVPSWVDRVTDLVNRLPGPSWLWYLGIGLILFLVQVGVPWVERVQLADTFLPIQGGLIGITVFFLALLHYLDNATDRALDTLQPALTTTKEAYDELRYRLITLPWLPTLLICLVVTIAVVLMNVFLGTPTSFDQVAHSPASAIIVYAMYILTWWVVSTLVYHTIHQLRAINHIYTNHTRINLYRTAPLYAFSSVTALTAVGLIIPTYIWLAINPGLLLNPIALTITLPISGLALVVFIWPLLGIHRLLVEEKTRLRGEAALRFEAAIAKLHQRVDSENLEGMDELNKAIDSLEIERKALREIPTWPWQPETVRLLVTALALPLGLWLIQFILQRLLVP